MKSNRLMRVRPQLQQLEDRQTPAIALSAGSLLITNSTAIDICVVGQGNHYYQVLERTNPSNNYINFGAYPAIKNIVIATGNGNDSITVKLVSDTLTGSLIITGGGGNDKINVIANSTGPAVNFTAQNIFALGDAGNDSVTLGTGGFAPLNLIANTLISTGAGDDSVVVNSDVTVGKKLIAIDFGGTNTVCIHGAAASFAGFFGGGNYTVVFDTTASFPVALFASGAGLHIVGGASSFSASYPGFGSYIVGLTC